jgi:uncharacterized DUF497 family protein
LSTGGVERQRLVNRLIASLSVVNSRMARFLTRRGERLRPVSCRPMRRHERKVYEEAIREKDEVGSS